jgi:hypothetical protein
MEDLMGNLFVISIYVLGICSGWSLYGIRHETFCRKEDRRA